jgi:cyclopropane fatty-acyl-phospholipid synthase-like methyltransferase
MSDQQLKHVEDLIQKLETTLKDSSINVEDIAEIWNETVKKVQNIPAVKQEGTPANKRWANFVQEKSTVLKNKGNAALTTNRNKEAIAW